MDPENKPTNSQLRAIFLAALDRPPENRQAYLVKACGADLALLASVQALLDHHKDDDFLQDAAPGSLQPGELLKQIGSHRSSNSLAEMPGDLIGRYKLLTKLGEGGFGAVYLAEQQEPVRRNIALKVVKLGMDTRQVIARFENERQSLALMDHPYIAKVLDAGATETGRPYFVMEFVDGIRITEYCERKRLDTDARLALFIKVCQAIQYAHQKGVIHRDVKPSNILVADQEGIPVPRVIDFGIAKATVVQGVAGATMVTSLGQFVGTPEYMSPEQATKEGIDVDTRSDIYSLGVLLYELLTGTRPFCAKDFSSEGIENVFQRIRESEPARPSTRLKSLPASGLISVADQHRTTGGHLLHTVQGDLDWIVMKALEKDPSRRYGTATELAADVQRFRSHEVILARPPSRIYRFKKLARRNWAAVSAAAIFGLIVSSFLLVLWQERNLAEMSKQQADAGRASALLEQGIALAASERYGEAKQIIRDSQTNRLDPKFSELRAKLAMTDVYRLSPLPIMTIPTGQGGVPSAVVSPDEKWIISGGEDGTICVWSWPLGTKSRAWLAHEGGVRSVAVAPNGRLCASGGSDGKIKLWNLNTGEINQVLDFKGEVITSVAFSPQGDLLASASFDHTIRLWDVSSGKQNRLIETKLQGITKVAFSPDGSHLAAGGVSGGVTIWSVSNRNELPSFQVNVSKATFAWAPDGMHLAIGDKTGKVSFRPIEKLEFSNGDTKVSSAVSALAMDSNWHIIIGGIDGSIISRDMDPKNHSVAFTDHKTAVTSLTTFPHSRFTLSSGKDGNLMIWAMESSGKIFSAHHVEVTRAVYSPDGLVVLTSGGDGVLKLWDAETGGNLMEYRGHLVQGIAARNPESGADLFDYAGHKGKVLDAAFDPNGWQILSSGMDHTVRIWNLTNGDMMLKMQGDAPVRRLLLTHAINFILAAEGGLPEQRTNNSIAEWPIQVWDKFTGNALPSLQGHALGNFAVSGRSKPARDGQMKTGHFESGIAHDAVHLALMGDEPTQCEPAAFYQDLGGQRLVRP